MASSSRVVSVDILENLLNCSVCLETLNDPRTLPCFHSFCKCCLEKFVKSHRDETVADGKEIEDFNCPTCRSVFTLKPKEEVAGMSSSHFIRNMLDVMAIQSQANVAMCSRCKEPASCRCTTCALYICEQCSEFHESWPGFKKHTVLSINELIKPENQSKIRAKLYCKEHVAKKLKFYCESCKELICRYCMEFNHGRRRHLCYLIQTVAEKQREELKSSSDILDHKLMDGNQALEAISNVTKTLKDNAERAKNEIVRHKEEVKESILLKLEEKARIKINEVDQMYNKTVEKLTVQRKKLQSYVDKVKGSVNLSKNLLEKGNDEEILLSQRMIEESVEKAERECPRRMQPIHDGEIRYRSKSIDEINLTEVLDDFGEVGANGGYTGCIKRSSSSFLFSLRNKDNLPPFKAPALNDMAGIYDDRDLGPCFTRGICSGFDLHIASYADRNRRSFTDLGNTYKPPEGYLRGSVDTNSLLSGSYKFTPTEIEVFY